MTSLKIAGMAISLQKDIAGGPCPQAKHNILFANKVMLTADRRWRKLIREGYVVYLKDKQPAALIGLSREPAPPIPPNIYGAVLYLPLYITVNTQEY